MARTARRGRDMGVVPVSGWSILVALESWRK
jgi:hypothetical protein